MSLGPEPRINSKFLSKHRGQTVRLPGKVIKLVGDSATVQASDGGEDMHIEDTFVEIIGTVKDDLSVKALTSINLGKSLNMKAVDAVIEFAHSSKGDGVLA